ncbi:sigma factor-like helix-turn-helix DNA-binding protein [Clostridium butyricum]|uniref:sigma factor-like helix-turn-helix DNA-binding protein n=1 Tax=Clostridium butyricum TaxID=1492 RepID=UPI00374EFE4B
MERLYINIYIKKIGFVEISENWNLYGWINHIEGINKLKAHKQIKQSDYVLFCLDFLRNYFQRCNKFHLFWKLWSGKGKKKKSLPLCDCKGGYVMQVYSFEKAIEIQFDCLSKKVIKCEQKKYYRDISNRQRREVIFSDLPEKEFNKFYTLDDYSSNYTVFNVLGMEVQVLDEQLSKALKILPEKKRNIILLSYFMDMSDLEIGKLMNLVRSTIYRHRTSTLNEIKKLYKEESKYEKE